MHDDDEIVEVEMKSSVLRPVDCKFCGGYSELTHRAGGWTVDCKNADPFASVFGAIKSGIFCKDGYERECVLFDTPNDAIINWNKDNKIDK